jgi:hypothetical protein
MQVPPIPASGSPVDAAEPMAPLPLAAPMPPGGPVSADVKTVVLPGAANGDTPDTVTFTITPLDTNLRNALDRWLQTQGWQLAWSLGDDLSVEFNATFSGSFTSILEQAMKATSQMRTPARVCRYTNDVIRVIARAANCKD